MSSVTANPQRLQATKTRNHEIGFVLRSLLRVFVFSWPKAPQILIVLVAAWTIGLAAQQPPGSKTGNPTPGTPQPEPPNVADRITLTGCVQAASAQTGRRPVPALDSNSPSDSRFVLVKAERLSTVPADTGTSAASESAASSTYRLNAIDSQLSPFVGTKVEISGEVLPPTSSGDGNGKAPVLQVEFVQKLSPACQ